MEDQVERQDIYNEAITDIVNTIHECSRTVEGIEGKVKFITNNGPVSPISTASEETPEYGAPPQKGTTDLSESLAQAHNFTRDLLHRIQKLETNIII